MIGYDAREIWNPACCTPAYSYGGIMIALVNRLNRYETDADKEEFVKGAVGLTPAKGKKAAVVGFAAGYLLSKKLFKNG
jgi:hypothetical protein